MIGVVADDLTGAVGLRYGLKTEVLLEGKPGIADLVCFDSDSRSRAPEEAAMRASSAAQALSLAGARWVYKKVDSVLRGHVSAEIEAIAGKVGAKRVLLVPANPSLGRRIRNGTYLINGRPLDETEFARDPEHPRLSAEVIELLGSGAFPITVCRVGNSLPKEGIIVGEAETTDDLRQWSTRRGEVDLLAGGAEFFAALLRGDYTQGRSNADDCLNLESNKRLFISGTNSEASREFINRAKSKGTPVFELPSKLAQGAELSPADCEEITQQVVNAFECGGSVILRIGLPKISQLGVARRLVIYLVQVAEQVLRQMSLQEVYVEGGATAAELVRRIGWNRLHVFRERAPGVVTLAPATGKSLRLTLKPGSYAWPKEMDELPHSLYNIQNA